MSRQKLLSKPYVEIQIPSVIIDKASIFETEVLALKTRYSSTNLINKRAHFISKIGEWVASQCIGGEVNWEVTNFGDGKVDLMTPQNFSVDIKTSSYFDKPYLWLGERDKVNLVDYYGLCSISNSTLVGRFWGVIISKEAFLQNSTFSKNRCIPYWRLNLNGISFIV